VDGKVWRLYENWRVMFYNCNLTLRSVLQIYTYSVLLQSPKTKTCLSNGHRKWKLSISNETLDT